MQASVSTNCKTHQQYEALLNPERRGSTRVYLTVIPNAHSCLYPYAYWIVCEQAPDAREAEELD